MKKDRPPEGKKMPPVKKALIIFLALYALTLLGFLITFPHEISIPYTAPYEEVMIETITTPLSEIERLECKVAKYEVVDEKVVDLQTRKLTLLNKQDESWSFTVQATFSFSNRTSTDVPPYHEEAVTHITLIPPKATQELTFSPSVNATHYSSTYVNILVTPEKKECEVDVGVRKQEKIVAKKVTQERTYQVPFVERRPLWRILWGLAKN